jgi:protein phosphatase
MGAGASDQGNYLDQEDAWFVGRRDGAVLCVVCDGMGAATSGRPAADLVVAHLREQFEAGAPTEEVLRAVSHANESILLRSEATRRRDPGSDPRWCGMGTTADVALFVSGQALLAHVGNGRILRYRRAALEALTVDHTLMEDAKRMTPQMSKAQLDALPVNVITRALGMKSGVAVDRADVDALRDDIFVLATDGITTRLDDPSIAAILARGGTEAEMADVLVAAARAIPGAHDNMTVVVHEIGTT